MTKVVSRIKGRTSRQRDLFHSLGSFFPKLKQEKDGEKIMIKQFLKDESGQDIVEYSLLLVLIGAVAVLILTGMGTSISNIFTKITNTLNDADRNIPGGAGGTSS